MPNPINGAASGIPGAETRPMFRALGIASSGMSAQRVRLEVIASNIANAETTRTADGTPYQRQMAQVEAVNPGVPALPGLIPAFGLPETDPSEGAMGVRVASITRDETEGPLIYDPGHPDADEAGYVRYPNVSITDEMVDLMSARRVYEANVSVFQAAKAMLRRSLEL